jgi:hypothetical protein
MSGRLRPRGRFVTSSTNQGPPANSSDGVRWEQDAAAVWRWTPPPGLWRAHLDPVVTPSVTFDGIYSPMES